MRQLGNFTLLLALFGACVAQTPVQAQTIPGAANLQRQADYLRDATKYRLSTGVLVPTLPPIPSPTALELRQDTRLTLAAIDLRGVTQLTPEQIAPLFETLNGQETSLAEVDKTLAALNDLYQQQGYILSRAFLPEQEIRDGTLIIQALEGKLEDVTLNTNGRVAENPLVEKLISQINRETPTRQNLENVLLKLNDLPGLAATANLAPGKQPGTAVLGIAIAETRAVAELGFSNHGTRYIGPNRFEDAATLNNILSPGGDRFTLNSLISPNLSDIRLYNATYALPLNSHGTVLELGGYTGNSNPQWTLEDLDINSTSFGANITLTQNLARSRAFNWSVYGMFDWQDTDSTSLSQQLSADHTRVLRLGTNTTNADSWRGLNSTKFELSHGLDVLAASGRGNTQTSRLRGRGEGFTKAKLDLSRLQYLNETWNLLLAGSGQFSTHALLAGEEFGVGGENIGRGFDTNELAGEQGLGTRAELQATFHPDAPWLEAWQLFGFYDFGMVWNKDRDIFQTNQAETLSSIGFGARLQFSETLSGEVMLANPMTHIVASNGDKNPTIYFRLKGRFATTDTPKMAGQEQTTPPPHKEGES